MAEHKLNSKTSLTHMCTTKSMEFKNSIMIARAIKRKHSILSVNLNLPAKQSVGRIQYVTVYQM